MAHFAKIGLNSEVMEVLSVHNDVLKDANGDEQEALGLDFLTKLTGWAIWKQTSYNTRGNKHNSGDDSKAFRGNYCGAGHIYDSSRDAFISHQPYESWALNESTFLWEPPSPKPEGHHAWNESTKAWDAIA